MWGIIPAAGSGTRMGGTRKPFMEIGGKPLLQYCIDTFFQVDVVTRIAVALPAEGVDLKGGTLKAQLTPREVRVEAFSIRGGEGVLSAQGTLARTGFDEASVDWRAERFTALGSDVRPSTSEELGKFIRDDLARWRKVVRETGIKIE